MASDWIPSPHSYDRHADHQDPDFIRHQGDPSKVTHNGSSALLESVLGGHIECVNTLLADPRTHANALTARKPVLATHMDHATSANNHGA